MLTPSIGFCSTPFTTVGCGMPPTSRMVGTRSMTWWNWVRSSPAAAMPAGHEMATPLRVAPKCEATCLVHWNGASSAHAHAELKWFSQRADPKSSMWCEQPLRILREPVLERRRAPHPVQRPLGRRTVVAGEVDEQGVVPLTEVARARR